MTRLKKSSGARTWGLFTTATLFCLALATLCSCSGFLGKHAEPLSTKRDIQRAKPDAEDIDIRFLPLEDYSLLSKFPGVKQVNLGSRDGMSATDDKLRALAKLNFTNLINVTLLNGRLITDEGIRALSQIQSLKGLQLEGTAITDVALGILATNTHVTGVNVANCSGVTLKGLRAMVASETLDGITFSADKVNQEDVLGLFDQFKNVKWCEIVDPEGKLDARALMKVATERGFHLLVRPTGALQDMQWEK